VQTHQVVIGSLVQRVMLQQTPGIREGASILALLFQQQNQPLESVAASLL